MPVKLEQGQRPVAEVAELQLADEVAELEPEFELD